MSMTRRLFVAVAMSVATLGVAALVAGPAHAQRRDPGTTGPVTGTITMNAQGAAVGIGYAWGDGVLRYGGKPHRFTMNGLTIADVGYSQVRGTGRVYNLKRLEDFNGTYAAVTGEATIVSGRGGQVLRNANGVEIRVDQVTRGARLQGSADGITLTLN